MKADPEKLDHTPGAYWWWELDPDVQGGALVKAKDGPTVHVVARCQAHDAPMLSRAREVPHSCGHQGCPGPASAGGLGKVGDLEERARVVVDGFGQFNFAQLRAAIGDEKATDLWARVTALQELLK